MVDRRDVRRGGGDHNAEVSLDQMLAEGRGVGGAAARAGYNDLRRLAPQPLRESGENCGENLILSPHGFRSRSHVGGDLRVKDGHLFSAFGQTHQNTKLSRTSEKASSGAASALRAAGLRLAHVKLRLKFSRRWPYAGSQLELLRWVIRRLNTKARATPSRPLGAGRDLEAMIEGQFSAVAAVRAARPAIERAGLAIERRLRGPGRLVYVGAGTSGRLAAQDGAELMPTFGWPHDRLLLLIAAEKTLYCALSKAPKTRTSKQSSSFGS